MKKCIVLDLDNTLWGGVIGEDGMDGLQLSLSAPGNYFMAFQQAILDHYDRGIILAINSRNNPDDAWKVIRTHPNMILKEKHFAAARMNWNDKAANIRELAQELNIGLDAMVFLDDDPTNRDLVRALVPEVLTPELPAEPAEYVRFLNSLGVFEAGVITDEDKMRGNLYVTERLRTAAEKSYASKEEFLKSLGLTLTVRMDDASCVSRLAQLTEKTNQFNIDKKPLTEDEIRAAIDSPTHHVFYGKLQDKFGDHGVVLFALIEAHADHWHIPALLMSCRVFGRGAEDAFLAAISEKALQEGVHSLTISFKDSPKNAPAREFVERRFPAGTYSIPRTVHGPEWIEILSI
jgi:FkbH-like protein